MPASDRPAAVAAALEFLRKSSYRSGAHDRVPEMMRHNCKVDEAIALLREPQPEPGNVLPPHVCDGSGCCKEAQPEPAPVGGEDEALLARIDSVIEEYLLASLRTCQDRAVHKMEQLLVDLGTRLRAALADVARLTSAFEEDRPYIASLREVNDGLRADVARLKRAIASWKVEEKEWIGREKELMADVARGNESFEMLAEAHEIEMQTHIAVREELRQARADLATADHGLEIAWGIIANAGGGDWIKEGAEWTTAAERWRDEVMPKLSERAAIRARAGRNDAG